MFSYKRFVLLSLLSFFLITAFLFVFLILAFLYDPLHLYHKPYFWETKFSKDMRVQVKGILEHYDIGYDSFILGTSMLLGTPNKEANKIIGGKWINISLSGSTFNERAVILQYLFREKKPKHIIYSLDGSYMTTTLELNSSNFDYLYDENIVDDIRVYISKKYLVCLPYSFITLQDKCGENILQDLIDQHYHIPNNKDTAWLQSSWYLDIVNFLSKLTQKDIDSMQFLPYTKEIAKNQEYVEKYLLSFIRANPNTQFSLIVPTYSRFFYKLTTSQFNMRIPISRDINYYFSHWSKVIKWLVQECDKLPNATIYGFDDLDYADDIINYPIEVQHYNPNLNLLHLESIAKNEHILTPQNIDSYLATMQQKIQDYDLSPLIQMVRDSKKNESR